MKEKSKTSAIGFFKYFKGFIGNRIYIYILLNFLIGIFDGLGLAMFIPLISIATGSVADTQSMGKLEFLVKYAEASGMKLTITTVLLMMIVMFIIKGIFYYIKLNYLNKTQLIALRKIRYQMVKGLSDLSYEGFTKMDAGKIQNNMVGESGKLITAMSQYFISLQNIILLLTYVGMAVVSSWKFAIMVGVGGLLTNIFYIYINKIIKNYSRAAVVYAHVFNSNLIQMVINFKYLKATHSIPVFEKRLKENIKITEEIGYKTGRVSYIGESLREPLIIIIIVAVIYIQVEVFHNNFGSMMVSLLLFYRALTYLVSMQSSWSGFLRSSVGIESIENLLSDFKSKEEPKHNYIIEKIENIEVKNVCVTYGTNTILDQINLNILPKSAIAFVGESGAGKTTLANVICGLLEPHEGVVLTKNESIYDSNIAAFRKKIGYITQEAVIFDDTLYNNITFWAEKTQENIDKFYNVLEMVSLTDFIKNLEKREDAPLGNNGILISGGQKQRISIARELFKNVELLIMDEATAALDSETEKHIKESIDLLHGKFTLIIIAHRLSTIRNVDYIYLMDKGKIIEDGNYEDLLNISEKFRRMVNLQNIN